MCLGWALLNSEAAAVELRLASEGEALASVVIADDASRRVREAAQTLAHYLGRISAAEFDVVTGDSNTGVAIGVYHDFPALTLDVSFDADDPTRQEEYLLRTHENGAWLIGASELAVEHAVWDLLYELGHRQFFPGPTWEIVPQRESLSVTVDRFERPSFYQRTIGVGHGLMAQHREPHAQWRARNRFRSAVAIQSSHTYSRIIRANRATFDEHPEYLALVDGERRGSKFCISNPGLRQLVVNYAIKAFHDDPERQSISMEPSDGGNWCECKPCAEMGSVSDRVAILANKVAKAINDLGYGPKHVGLLAYHLHSPPPSVDVHPMIVVRAATNAVRGGYTHQQIIEGWQTRGATMGVSDFYSVFVWDSSMPARQKASDLPYIAQSLSRFHRIGARYFNCAISDNWGAAGLGAYVTSRILWDIGEARRIDALFEDFLARSFGAAREPMERFYRLINRIEPDDTRPLIRADMIARMYRALAEARELTDDHAVHRRLDELLLFTRYVQLYHIYDRSEGDQRQQALEDVLRHAYRMRDTRMVHTRAILAHLARRDRNVQQVDEQIFADDAPFTDDELREMLQAGIATTEVVELAFEPVSFSRELVPATALDLPAVERGTFGGPPIGQQRYYLWLDEPGEIRLRVSGGHIEHYRHLAGPVQLELFAADNPIEEPLDSDVSVPPDGKARDVTLHSEYANLHHIELRQPSNRARADTVAFGQPFTAEVSLDVHNRFSHIWTLYFYVPRGTSVVGGFATTPTGSVRDADGNLVLDFAEIDTPGYFHVPVPADQAGRLWRFHRVRGQRLLMTVPPFLARSGDELLLPREVVEADRSNRP